MRIICVTLRRIRVYLRKISVISRNLRSYSWEFHVNFAIYLFFYLRKWGQWALVNNYRLSYTYYLKIKQCHRRIVTKVYEYRSTVKRKLFICTNFEAENHSEWFGIDIHIYIRIIFSQSTSKSKNKVILNEMYMYVSKSNSFNMF